MQLNATEQEVSNQAINTRNSKPYMTSSRVVALFTGGRSIQQQQSRPAEAPSKTLGVLLTHCPQSDASYILSE